MATLEQARNAALGDINLLRALAKQKNTTDTNGIDVILRSVPIIPIELEQTDLVAFLAD